MKVAAIITEYNPFHNGHQYQIDKIREELGEDTAVIAIMSGNFTQRGDIAIADKSIRAKAAVNCGVNLVLELPFPFSMSSAEFFAKSGVKIANSLGVVDYLAFGSESGDLSELTSIADAMLSHEFSLAQEEIKNDAKYTNCGYPQLCEIALNKISNKKIDSKYFTPNNILAIEYIKALKVFKSDIKPYTVKRYSTGYYDEISDETSIQSATAIRSCLIGKCDSALEYVPKNAKSIYLEAIEQNKMPADITNLDIAVISSLRLNSPSSSVEIHDAAGGLYNRLCDLSQKATSISSLITKTETKKYTNARIRRAIWNAYFGVTSSDVRALPCYTQLLATDNIGRSLLRRIKKATDFPVITKPASYKSLGEMIIKQKELSNKADSVFDLSLKSPNDGDFSLKFTPYVKE